ncbi:MAG: hypothetical protein ACKVWV_15500 [Planctomycetota bacterium]
MEVLWIALVLAVVAVVAGIVVLAVRSERRRSARVDDVWRAFAAEHDLQWKPERGPWWHRRAGEAQGAVGDAPFTLERVYVSTGKSRITYTNLRSQLARPLGERVLVSRRSWLGRLGTAFCGPIVELGSSAFDARWLVRSRSRDAARGLLGEDVRNALLDFPRCARIEARGTNLRLYWRHPERDPRVLARGLEIVRAAVSTA